MKLLICLLSLVLLTVSAQAQDFEYGKPEELKGLTKIWVDTLGDIDTRNRIIERIQKDLPQLEVVENINGSQIRLQYKGESNEVVAGATTAYNTTILDRQTLDSGRGIVWINAHGANKSIPRLVINYANKQDNKLEKNPSVKFAKEFIKVYKKANGSK